MAKTVTIYGIKNCDTMKKARTWLEAHDITYEFHDYKKQGADRAQVERWVATAGLERVMNKTGTTYKKLPDKLKASLDKKSAIEVMVGQPSVIRRPIVEYGGELLVGFNPDEWSATFA